MPLSNLSADTWQSKIDFALKAGASVLINVVLRGFNLKHCMEQRLLGMKVDPDCEMAFFNVIDDLQQIHSKESKRYLSGHAYVRYNIEFDKSIVHVGFMNTSDRFLAAPYVAELYGTHFQEPHPK